MELVFEEVRARRVVNVHRHVDGPWFWTRYSAHPYVGCRSGCEFCYLRGGQYLGKRDPDSFDTRIQVKLDAAARLRAELPRLAPDVLACGDWQEPAEGRYQLSRQMLEVARDFSFPVFIVERSPLLARDLDLLVEIDRRAWVGVVLSFSNLDPALKRAFEPRSPDVKRRLATMEKLAAAGLLVGASLMPILPFVGDDEAHLDEAVKATRDHGGRFVLGAGMSMGGVQATRTLEAASRLDPELPRRFLELYGEDEQGRINGSAPRAYSARLGGKVRELCERHGLGWRMPRYIPDGPLGVNRWIAERLFLRCYELELELASSYRVWAYRKAAWAVDELSGSLLDVYREKGVAGLRQVPGIGETLTREIARWLDEWPAAGPPRPARPASAGPLFDRLEKR